MLYYKSKEKEYMVPVPGNLVRDHSRNDAIGLVIEIRRVPFATNRYNLREVWVIQLMGGPEVRHFNETLCNLEVIK